MIRYIIGDATDPQGDGTKIIAHCCNNIGAWGAGFVLALSKRWPEVETAYRADFLMGGQVALGDTKVYEVRRGLFVANMIALNGIRGKSYIPLIYEALEECLQKLALFATEEAMIFGPLPSIHMPRIGCGLAGGTWDEVGPIVERELADFDVTVYDLPGAKQ